MPDDRARHQEPRRDRTVNERAADHAAIDRLADELLPALVAKLSATGLGEIEVREGPWVVRIRRPGGGDGSTGYGRRSTDRPSRSQPGHAGHGHAPGAFEGHRSSRDSRDPRETRPAGGHSTNGASPPLTAVGPGPDAAGSNDGTGGRAVERRSTRSVALSPAVGVYQPRADARPGTRVRAGDRLGVVDMLGVGQEVVAPDDGLIGASLAEPGQAVEYGQELVVIELSGDAASSGRSAAPAGEG